MIRADEDVMKMAVQKALDVGINWFDTAAGYGDGKSEENLGRILKDLGAKPYVSTKLRIDPENTEDIPGQIERKLHESLERLQLDHIDLIQLHNGISGADGGRNLSTDNILGRSGAIFGMERMRDQGLIKWIGMTALGDSSLCRRLIESARLDTAQVYFNMINPTAAHAAARHSSSQMRKKKSTGQDFTGILDACKEFDVGVIAIRTLAAGVLATEERHGRESVITQGNSLEDDVRKAAGSFSMLGDQYGTKAQTSLRFALSNKIVSCIDFAVADLNQFDEGLQAVEMGPLPSDAMRALDYLYDKDYEIN
jgi:L-galactose dehydrogenase/L-glyceraldehyde 3-phosphate reductase